jgi:hypothetical protein
VREQAGVSGAEATATAFQHMVYPTESTVVSAAVLLAANPTLTVSDVISRVLPLNAAILDEETRELVADIVPRDPEDLMVGLEGLLVERMLQSHVCDRDMCVIGGRGQGKTFTARKFAAAAGYSRVETLHLYVVCFARSPRD